MTRWEFIGGLGSAASWPLAARVQQPTPMRRIGILSRFDDNDPRVRAVFTASRQNRFRPAAPRNPWSTCDSAALRSENERATGFSHPRE
jgi:hypothetical protein